MREEGSGPSAGAVIFSFFLGGLVGAGVALLLAPKPGRETRQKIKELAEEVKGRAEGYYEQAREKATSTVDKGKEFVEKNKSLVTSVIESGIEKGKDFVEKKKTLVTSAVEAGVEAYQREKGKITEGH
jgi:gas vesicle protein